MKKKTILRLILGIIMTVLIMALLFYFFLFLNPLNIYESNTLKWIPILICVISLYASGFINSETPSKFLVFLFVPYFIFQLFNFTYFPFILILVVTGILALVVTRKNQTSLYKLSGWAGIICIMLFHLFTQPLILEEEGFGYDDTGELINANILWDFSEEEVLVLPSHVLLDQDNSSFDMIDIKGKTYFVTFWATWCSGCIEKKPDLEELKVAYQNDHNAKFIDISFDDIEGNRWPKYLKDKKPLGLQLISKGQKKTSRALNFEGIPMYFIVKPDGTYKEYRSFDVAQKVFKGTLNSKAQLSVNGYTNYNLSGFDVLVEDSAFLKNFILTNTAIDLLKAKLLEISQFNIDQDKMDALKAVPIFMDWNTTTGGAQYHPSEQWLIANGYIPEKAMCIEISNITNFINWTNENQPYMVMHELAHAYHHRELDYNSSTITNAFNNANSNNLYTNVSYHAGGENYINRPTAYALNDEQEYFAEITEAYFGLNDYFPFDRNDLGNYDDLGFSAVISVWGD